MIKDDFDTFNIVQNDDKIEGMKTRTYKDRIKKCTKRATFNNLITKQAKHTKVNTIKYIQLETQKYMLSPIFINEEVNQLYALRSRTTNCKMNFKNRHNQDNLLCDLCFTENQDQKHLLKCKVIERKLKSQQVTKNVMEYENIYSSDVNKQKEITSLFMDIFKIKNELEQEKCQQAPSIIDVVLVNDDNLHCSIVHHSSGK